MGNVGQSDLDGMERHGIDPYELRGHVLKHFDYEIEDVKVEGDKATVSPSVTNANVKDAAERPSRRSKRGYDAWHEGASG
ncbi:hypothetical protein [Olsenella profusa]|nr:hypothetical protein [Olsenella profusa]